MPRDDVTAQPRRQVFQADALRWLQDRSAPDATSVMTSLPDISELPAMAFEEWTHWFVHAASAVIRWVPDPGMAIFYQSDIRFAGTWVDKGYLVAKAAEAQSAHLLWHKIVCRRPPLTVSLGRPSYSHLICVSRERRSVLRHAGPDVLPDAGPVIWSRGIGLKACEVACRFLREETQTRVVVDPFCGRGTVLAVANFFGFDAIGVELGGKRCRLARNLNFDESLLARRN